VRPFSTGIFDGSHSAAAAADGQNREQSHAKGLLGYFAGYFPIIYSPYGAGFQRGVNFYCLSPILILVLVFCVEK
jgi:hypothetical protein